MCSDTSVRESAALTALVAPVSAPIQKVSPMSGFLKIENLAKAYQADKPVFADVSFAIDKGEFVCIIGHSGCGKTTILNVLAGLDTATSGHCFMDGREIVGPSLERGVVFQSHALMPWLTVRQNIAFAVKSRWPDWSKAQIDEQVEKHVGMVGLLPAIDKKPSQLSGGMKQRVGIARAFAISPKMLLADRILLMTNGQETDQGYRPGGMAEVVVNPLPRSRTRAQLHHLDGYHDLRNHIVDFLVSRAKAH